MADVYDLFYPSPPNLKQLASISVALELCRRRRELHAPHARVDSSTLVADLKGKIPSTLIHTIQKYANELVPSITEWLISHEGGEELFGSNIFNDFSNLVCDFDGTIHFGKTAKRMMLCERISDDAKFWIACLYCFEEDVLRIWPSVSARINLNQPDNRKFFSIHPQLQYWSHRLTSNSPWHFQGPASSTPSNFSSVEYFWDIENVFNRTDLFDYCGVNEPYRYLLIKLDENELRTKLMTKIIPMILYSSKHRTETFNAVAVWMFIKDKLGESDFCSFVRDFFNFVIQDSHVVKKEESDFYEIWYNTPNHLKQAVITSLLSDSFLVFEKNFGRNLDGTKIICSFLSVVLSDMSIADRKKFWLTNWRSLMVGAKPADLRVLMNLCFTDENEIRRFEESVLYTYENIHPHGKFLLRFAYFEELNQFISSCCLEESKIKEIRLKLLEDNFSISRHLVIDANLFNKFIDNAYDDVNLANDFKRKLFNSPRTRNMIGFFLVDCQFYIVKQFVDIFATLEEDAIQVKRDVIAPVMLKLFRDDSIFEKGDGCTDFVAFLKWCLVNDDDVARFKQTLNIDGMMRVSKEKIAGRSIPINYSNMQSSFSASDYPLSKFLKWYFVTAEAFNEFKNKQTEESIRKMICDYETL